MNTDELMKLTKEKLVDMIIKLNKTNKNLEDQNKYLEDEIINKRLNDFLYKDYLECKEELERQYSYNRQNENTIYELNELLERYKNIVDGFGVRYE